MIAWDNRPWIKLPSRTEDVQRFFSIAQMGEREKKRRIPTRHSGSTAIASTSNNTPARAKPTTRTLVEAGGAAIFR